MSMTELMLTTVEVDGLNVMGMCTICGGWTYYDEDLGVMICDSCGADA